jgi:hypothetical protein
MIVGNRKTLLRSVLQNFSSRGITVHLIAILQAALTFGAISCGAVIIQIMVKEFG